MKTPRHLSGEKLAQCLCSGWDYKLVHQSGSHLILQTETPGHHRISVPRHESLRIGTLHQILKAVAQHKGVPREALLASL